MFSVSLVINTSNKPLKAVKAGGGTTLRGLALRESLAHSFHALAGCY